MTLMPAFVRVLFFMLFFSFTLSFSAEICDNGVDDDGDGLIDLNDTTDCRCGITLTNNIASLIPNPSFEEKNCCPTNYSQMNCAKNWVQASDATSDYHNTCGFMFSTLASNNLLPFPDGQAVVGAFILSDYKEYIGACLISPLLKDTSYNIQLNIAYVTTESSDQPCSTGFFSYGDFNLTLYGSTTCSVLPFSGEGCPPSADWKVIGEARYSPANSWSTINISFTPTENIKAVIIGSPCTLPAAYPERGAGQCYSYLYYDNLLLNKSSFFSSIKKEGSVCDNNLVLRGTTTANSTYQWYLNGIALINQKDSFLNVSALGYSGGNYTLQAKNGLDCVSNAIRITAAHSDSINIIKIICEGDNVTYGGQTFTDSGFYRIVTQTTSGCDSIIKLSLNVKRKSITNLIKIICTGQTYTVGSQTFNSTGNYQVILVSASLCDSIVNLDLTVKDSITPVVTITKDKMNICQGERLTFTGSVSGIANAPVIYQWYLNNAAVGNGMSTFSSTNFNNGDIVKLKVSTLDSCGNAVSVMSDTLRVDFYQISYIKPHAEYCLKDSFDIDLHLLFTPSVNYTITWTDGTKVSVDSTPHHVINSTSSSWLKFEIKYGEGCTISDTLNYTVNPLPSVDALTDSTLVRYDDIVHLDAASNNIVSAYKWIPAANLSSDVIKSPIATIKGTTLFTIKITDDKSCTATDSVLVTLFDDCSNEFVFIPTAFSPNNDGVNDCFGILNPPKLLSYRLVIYDRWYEKIFETTDVNTCWDGRYNGSNVQTDTYAYLLTIVCANGNPLTKKGTITLLR